MAMHWTSYLVRLHPEVDSMDERMERAHRSEVITDRFIRPQADEIALAYETKINKHHPLWFYAEKPTWFDRYSI